MLPFFSCPRDQIYSISQASSHMMSFFDQCHLFPRLTEGFCNIITVRIMLTSFRHSRPSIISRIQKAPAATKKKPILRKAFTLSFMSIFFAFCSPYSTLNAMVASPLQSRSISSFSVIFFPSLVYAHELDP